MRKLTKAEKKIQSLQKSLPCMKKSVDFLGDMKKAKTLRRKEESVYELYFHYSVETENQNSGMTYETGGNVHLVSRKATELKAYAKAFNAMSEDEKLAVLIQLFPKDFEFDDDECVIGFDDAECGEDTPKIKASVQKRSQYKYA